MPIEQAELQREAAALAKKHYEIEDGITQIFRINQSINQSINQLTLKSFENRPSPYSK